MADELERQIDKLLLVQKAKELDIKVDSELNKQMLDIQRSSKIVDPGCQATGSTRESHCIAFSSLFSPGTATW